MDLSSAIKQSWDKIMVILLIFVAILCTALMVRNLHKAAECESLSSYIRKAEPLTNATAHKKYEFLISILQSPYSPEYAHIRNIFARPHKILPSMKHISSNVVKETGGFKTIPERLKVTSIYRKPVKLLFKGYIQLGDGTYVSTINWAGKTAFKKIGDEIRGYKLIGFDKKVIDRKTLWGGTKRVDNSILTLQRRDNGRLSLEMGTITLEKEIFAGILDRKQSKKYDVHIGDEILGNKILDISADGVIILNSKGEKFYLKR